ncbi:uncharacterized protein WCC33_011471 [Rhinophrynus dorsalis]
MEHMASLERPLTLSVPALSKDDKYHVFISYCSKDSIWVYGLIHRLEETLPSLKICYHEKNFLPGKTIIDNMTECIQQSQKTLMVLSPDFVRSRWCLFEANLSIFRDCLGNKTIIPIMLRPCQVPLHLSHLTYLEAEDDQLLEKLVKILLNSTTQEDDDIMFHYQSSILYNGKSLLTLSAVNENDPDCNKGIFSESTVPDSLRAVVEDSELYKQAIQIINSTPNDKHFLDSRSNQILFILLVSLIFIFIILESVWALMSPHWRYFFIFPLGIWPVVIVIYRAEIREKTKSSRKPIEMTTHTGQANLFLMTMSILAGCPSKSQLFFVYVSLKKCMQTFNITFRNERELATKMWEKAIVHYSSAYACCVARKYFPFNDVPPPGHMKDGIFFCQYVAIQIKYGNCP